MFTGIIEHTGEVENLKKAKGELVITSKTIKKSIPNGTSIAVNGACLTVISCEKGTIILDVMPETFKRTNLGHLKSGDRLNLEFPLQEGDYISGHFVSGHIDTTAKLVEVQKEKNAYVLTFQIHDTYLTKYIVEKGSICLNGISLTIMSIDKNIFSVGIIPHTWKHTNLSDLAVGDSVNVEVDILAKYIEKVTIKQQ